MIEAYKLAKLSKTENKKKHNNQLLTRRMKVRSDIMHVKVLDTVGYSIQVKCSMHKQKINAYE